MYDFGRRIVQDESNCKPVRPIRRLLRKQFAASAAAKAAAKEKQGPDTEESYEVWLRSGRSSSILAKRTQNIGEGVGVRLKQDQERRRG